MWPNMSSVFRPKIPADPKKNGKLQLGPKLGKKNWNRNPVVPTLTPFGFSSPCQKYAIHLGPRFCWRNFWISCKALSKLMCPSWLWQMSAWMAWKTPQLPGPWWSLRCSFDEGISPLAKWLHGWCLVHNGETGCTITQLYNPRFWVEGQHKGKKYGKT